MITYSWKSKEQKEQKGQAETLAEFKAFLHDKKKEIAYITTEIDGKYWQFDLRGGWKELDHDPEDLPF
mgnify:CR=1 FL=1